MRAPRASSDAFLGALGVLFGLGSLTYPFGRDQGLYYYVAREWVLRGAVPYRDVLDHKTPGIYLLHALSVLLFGEQMWGIRLFDLACVVVVGVVAGSLSASLGESVRSGVRGATVLATSVLYYGYLNFWDTAQSELWYGMFGIASVAAAARIRSIPRSALVAGVCGGCAMLVKPPAIWMVMVAFVWLLRRSIAEKGEHPSWVSRAKPALRAALRFGAGAASFPAVVLAYFGAKGALPAMIDIVVGANSFYVKHERGGGWAGEAFVNYHWCYFPLVPALLLYLIVSLVRARRAGDRSAFARYVIVAAVTAGAYAAVIMQGKYYLLHWSVMIPAFATIASNVARSMADRCAARTWAFAPSVMTLMGGLYLGASYTWHGPAMWWTSTEHAWRWTRGHETREAFTDHFQLADIKFWFQTSEQVGVWLRDHTTPDDLVSVRGFQPEIYAVSKRHHGGRFFWTTFLTNPARAYRREEWLREDMDALLAHPPKYVVALTDEKTGPDSPTYFEPLGYRTVKVIWGLTIMERAAAAVP